jgi:hypothetical protein
LTSWDVFSLDWTKVWPAKTTFSWTKSFYFSALTAASAALIVYSFLFGTSVGWTTTGYVYDVNILGWLTVC